MSDLQTDWWRDLVTSILQTTIAASVIGIAVALIKFFRQVLSLLRWQKRHRRWHKLQGDDSEADE
jgi:hypothetical protein